MNKNVKRRYFLILIACLYMPCGFLSARTKRYHKKRTQKILQEKQHINLETNIEIPTSSPREIEIPLISKPQKTEKKKDPSHKLQHDTLKPPTISLTQREITAPDPSHIETIRSILPPELRKEKKPETLPAVSEIELAEKIEKEKIEFYFEDADLQTLIKQIEELFDVTFLTDEMIQPIATKDGKPIKGNKISFKTHKPLSKKEAWDLFIAFLDLAGFNIVQDADPKRFRIKTTASARKSPIPSFIGIDPSKLPDNDELIRYVYFIENSTLDAIKNVVESLRSTTSSLVLLSTHKAFILTDKAYNIKTLMKIIKELDKVSMPQSMSVLKLRRADAQQVKDLYDSLIKSDEYQPSRLFSARKQPTSLYFPENTSVIAEPRTNALILLGPKNAIKKIEDFIIKHIDVELDQAYSPLHVHQLRYADATTVADIMNNVSQFGKDTQAGKSGGVRGKDKYLKPLVFVPEQETNRLIIKGNYEDYLVAKNIIEKLDEAQPQVAIEILILAISLSDQKELGTQLRSKDPGPDSLLGRNVKFQTSGLRQTKGIVENTAAKAGVKRLLGDLMDLVSGVVTSPGNTLITLGFDNFGVWGIFQALQTITNAQIVSNPFLIATNKTPAMVSLGETRRVVTSTIVGTRETNALGDDSARLEVTITPQINSDGMIILDLDIVIDDFINTDPTTAEKNVKRIKTTTVVADKEVLALGGLIRNKVEDALKKTPILGDIPVLGWLFKNKRKIIDQENLLILISTRIIEPQETAEVREYTREYIQGYDHDLSLMQDVSEKHDPIHKLFFESSKGSTEQAMDDFLFKRQEKENQQSAHVTIRQKQRSKRKQKSKKQPAAKKPAVKLKPTETQLTHLDNPEDNTADKKKTLYQKIKNKRRTKLSLNEFFDNMGAQA